MREGATADECRALIDDWLQGWVGGTSVQGAALVVTSIDADVLVGQIGLGRRAGGIVEIVDGIAPAWRGRGLATEATRLGATWLLETAQASEVELLIGSHHRESQRVATKAGFVSDGAVTSRVAATGVSYEDQRYLFPPPS